MAQEQCHRWKPAGCTVAAVLISIGGLLNGLDTGSIGAITVMPAFSHTFGLLSPTMRGFTVSLIMLFGAFPAFMAGQVADKYGRLPTIAAGTLVFLVGVLLQATSFHLVQFLVGRALAGLGEGIWLSNVTVYIAEIAPRRNRGVYGAGPMFGTSAGLVIGYFICYATARIQSSAAWRLPYVVQGTFALVLVISCVFLPASPRWLVLHGQNEKALEAAAELGLQREELEHDIVMVRDSEQQENKPSVLAALAVVFRRQYRSRLVLGFFVLGGVQLSGIDGVLFYSPIIFQQAGLPAATAGFLASGLSAILMFVISIVALLCADRWGRRTCMITGGILLAGSMFLIGILYASHVVAPLGVARWVVIVSIFIFAISYNGTWGTIGKIYASEIQSAEIRAGAVCLAQGLGFFTNWLVAFVTPIFLAKSSYGAYFLFGGLSLFIVLILAVYMPETRGKSLESISEDFETSSTMASMKQGISVFTRREVGHDMGAKSEA